VFVSLIHVVVNLWICSTVMKLFPHSLVKILIFGPTKMRTRPRMVDLWDIVLNGFEEPSNQEAYKALVPYIVLCVCFINPCCCEPMDMFNSYEAIPTFFSKNFDIWATKMRTRPRMVDLWDIVLNGFEEPSNQEAYKAFIQDQKDQLITNKKNDAATLFLIQQGLDESILTKVAATTRFKSRSL
jgi:hypothetical protein